MVDQIINSVKSVLLILSAIVAPVSAVNTCDNNVPIGGYACAKDGEAVIYKCKQPQPNQVWEQVDCVTLGGGVCSNTGGTPHCTGSSTNTSPITTTGAWSCGSHTASADDMIIFNSTWCDGQAQWLKEACNIGAGGGPLKSVVNNVCPGANPAQTLPVPASAKNCSYANYGEYACLSSTECVRCSNNATGQAITLRNQDTSFCTGRGLCGNSEPEPETPSTQPVDPIDDNTPSTTTNSVSTCPVLGNRHCVDANTSESYQTNLYGWIKEPCPYGCDTDTGKCKTASGQCIVGDRRCSDEGAQLCNTSGWQTQICPGLCSKGGFCCDPKKQICDETTLHSSTDECYTSQTKSTDDKFGFLTCVNGKYHPLPISCYYGFSASTGHCCDPTCETCNNVPPGHDLEPVRPAVDPTQWSQDRFQGTNNADICPSSVGYRCDAASQKCVGDSMIFNHLGGAGEEHLDLPSDELFICCQKGCEEETISGLGIQDVRTCADWAKDPKPDGLPNSWWPNAQQTYCDKNGRNNFTGCVQLQGGYRGLSNGYCVSQETGQIGSNCCMGPDTAPSFPPPPAPNPAYSSCPEQMSENDQDYSVCYQSYTQAIDIVGCKNISVNGCNTIGGKPGTFCCRIGEDADVESCSGIYSQCTKQPVPGTSSASIYTADEQGNRGKCLMGNGDETGHFCTKPIEVSDPSNSQPQNIPPVEQAQPINTKTVFTSNGEAITKVATVTIPSISTCLVDGSLSLANANGSTTSIPKPAGKYCWTDPQTNIAYYKDNENFCGTHKLGDHWQDNDQCYVCAEAPLSAESGKNLSVTEPKYQVSLPNKTLSGAYCKADNRYKTFKLIMSTIGNFEECVKGLCPNAL